MSRGACFDLSAGETCGDGEKSRKKRTLHGRAYYYYYTVSRAHSTVAGSGQKAE